MATPLRFTRLSGLLVCLTLLAPPASAGEAKTSASGAAADDNSSFPLGGSATFTTSLGRGTFNTGVEYQPLVNLHLSLRPQVTLHEELKIALSLRFDLWADVVENAYSGSTEREQLFWSDLTLTGTWAEFVALEDAHLSWSAAVALVFPTSQLSQTTSKVLGLRAGVTTAFEPLEWLTVSHDITATKNFNLYDTAVLDDDDFTVPPQRRPGGAESVASGLTATGEGITEWALSNSLSVELTFFDKLGVLIDFTLLHAWRYKSIPKDDRSSEFAEAGRGRSDVMSGTIEVSYELLEFLSVSLGTVTEQAPKTADNESFRFPFWDTTNGVLNRQVFYLAVAASL